MLFEFHLFRENMPSHFKVKEYCPLVFRNLRERFGVDDVDYRESLTRSQPLGIDSSGKSGAQFYQSYDKFFIIKSLTSEEIERMHAFLKHYHPVSLPFYTPCIMLQTHTDPTQIINHDCLSVCVNVERELRRFG